MVVAVAVAVAVAEKNTKTHEQIEKRYEFGQILRAVRVSGEGGGGSWALTTVSDLSIKKLSHTVGSPLRWHVPACWYQPAGIS